jgi:excisionase family DNA binding protein
MEGGTRLARSLEEVGQLFGISKDTLRRAAARGELRVIRISKRLLVPEEEVKRLSQEGLGRHLAKPARAGRLRKAAA